MRTPWSAGDYAVLLDRIGRLSPDTPARWGRMQAPQMLAHLTEWYRMAMGELPIAPRRMALRFPPLKQFAIYMMPFPKGLPTAPELLARAPAAWSGEVDAVRGVIERFAARGPHDPWPAHPIFGPMTARQWRALQYRHSDHHLRQFGV